MKISLSAAQKLLEELGVDVEVVAENDDKDVDVEVLAEEVKEYLKSPILDGAKADIEADLNGKFLGTLRSAVQRTMNIPKKEMEGKTLQDILNLVKTNTESKGGEEANEWKTKYEAAVQDYEAQIENANSTWQAKYDADLTAANKKYADRDIDDAFISMVNKMPRQGGDPVKQAKVLRQLAESEGIQITFDEAKKAVQFMKEGKPLKAEETLSTLAADVLPMAKNTSHIPPTDASKHTAGVVTTNVDLEGIPAAGAMGDFIAMVNNS